MRTSKEAELITAVLMYAVRCLAEGDLAALRAMKFGAREIEALREMSLADFYRIEALRAHCLEIYLNRQVYWPMVDYLREQRESEEVMQSLIAADAPREMLQVLFGLNSSEYSRLRRSLSVDPVIGRPAEPDDYSSNTLWRIWSKRTDVDESGLLAPKAYLEIHAKTGLSMRSIWHLTRRWVQYGHLADQLEPPTPEAPGKPAPAPAANGQTGT